MSFSVSQAESFPSSRANQMTVMKPQRCAYHISGRYPTTISEILYRHLVLTCADSRRTGKTFSYRGSLFLHCSIIMAVFLSCVGQDVTR